MADAEIKQIGEHICPRCQQPTVVPIAYGMPSMRTFERAERGEVVLGGCCISADDPVAQCTKCGWKRKRKDPRWVDGPEELRRP